MKAIVFTHFLHKRPADTWHFTAETEDKIIKNILPYFKACLKCRNIGLVYVYVDTGLRQIHDNLFKGGSTLELSVDELAYEDTTRNILKLAVDQATRELTVKNASLNKNTLPKFQFIGLPHLASLLASLYRIDPNLVKNLGGHNFTYDTPKFVEAVIRLARGNDISLSQDPVFRFDADAEVNEKSISILLNRVNNALIRQYKYSFFSGGYGDPKGKINDPVNDYAVRSHWLVQKSMAPQTPYILSPEGMQFLRDIGEFGATQIPNAVGISPSLAMKNYQIAREQDSMNRDSAQVISGPGLYMSRAAIRALPPFINFENNVIWVDDHLKRRLHEAVGHLAPAALERVTGALFKQNRYPEGILPRHIEWAKQDYFYRLLSGCIMHALITDRTGNPGQLAIFIKTFLDTFQVVDASQLCGKFTQVAIETTTDLLTIWQKANYGNTILGDWAETNLQELAQGKGKLVDWINSTVQDAIRYCKLVQEWNAYVFAIQRLGPRDAYWLFRSIDP